MALWGEPSVITKMFVSMQSVCVTIKGIRKIMIILPNYIMTGAALVAKTMQSSNHLLISS